LYFLGAVKKVLITLNAELYWPDNVSGDPQAHFSLLLIGPQAPAPCFPLAGQFCRRDANGSKILCTYNGTSVCGQVILEWQQHILLLDPKRRDNLGLSDIFAYGSLNSGYGQSGLNVHSYVKRSTQVVGHINYRKNSVLKILFEGYAVIKRRGGLTSTDFCSRLWTDI
jgi:hypothetical protein